MAKETMVRCAHASCPNSVPIADAKQYHDISKGKEPLYFCSADCALAHLYGIVRKFDEFMFELGKKK